MASASASDDCSTTYGPGNGTLLVLPLDQGLETFRFLSISFPTPPPSTPASSSGSPSKGGRRPRSSRILLIECRSPSPRQLGG